MPEDGGVWDVVLNGFKSAKQALAGYVPTLVQTGQCALSCCCLQTLFHAMFSGQYTRTGLEQYPPAAGWSGSSEVLLNLLAAVIVGGASEGSSPPASEAPLEWTKSVLASDAGFLFLLGVLPLFG